MPSLLVTDAVELKELTLARSLPKPKGPYGPYYPCTAILEEVRGM